MASLTSVYFVSIVLASLSSMAAAFIGHSITPIKNVSDQPLDTNTKPVPVAVSQ